MKFTLKLLEEADLEFQDAALWYEMKSKGLGERFIDTITKKLETIQEHPERYPKRKNLFREAPIRIFPFIVVYTFYRREKKVIVSSIFHTRKNPRKKYRKG